MKDSRTTVALRIATKARLDVNRAPGQCYDGFIWQLVDLWERSQPPRRIEVAGPAGGNQGAGVFSSSTPSLNGVTPPPVSGALGVIGLSGGTRRLM